MIGPLRSETPLKKTVEERNKAYSDAVDKLIPFASAHTNRRIKRSDYTDLAQYKIDHCRTFLKQMERLKKAHCLGMYKNRGKKKIARRYAIGVEPAVSSCDVAIWDKTLREIDVRRTGFTELLDLFRTMEKPDVYVYKPLAKANGKSPSAIRDHRINTIVRKTLIGVIKEACRVRGLKYTVMPRPKVVMTEQMFRKKTYYTMRVTKAQILVSMMVYGEK